MDLSHNKQLQFQSKQYAFSAAATPAIAGVSRAIDLIDEEPHWQKQLWENINYYKKGLLDIGQKSEIANQP